MFTEFRYAMRRSRGAIIGWSIGLTLYSLMMGYFFSSIKEMASEMDKLMDLYPQELMGFFRGIEDFGSPFGYLDTYFFSMMTIIVGIYAVSACGNLLISDEEKGILDLTISHPITRSSLFWSRFLAWITSLAIIMGVTLMGWLIPSQTSGLDFTFGDLFVSFSTLYCLLVIFGAIALLLSMFLPSAKMTVAASAGLLVANFLLEGMSGIEESLKAVYELTPFYFFQASEAITDFKPEYLLGLLGVSLIFVLIAWWRFERREIRVGGEGGWQFPLPAFLKRG